MRYQSPTTLPTVDTTGNVAVFWYGLLALVGLILITCGLGLCVSPKCQFARDDIRQWCQRRRSARLIDDSLRQVVVSQTASGCIQAPAVLARPNERTPLFEAQREKERGAAAQPPLQRTDQLSDARRMDKPLSKLRASRT